MIKKFLKKLQEKQEGQEAQENLIRLVQVLQEDPSLQQQILPLLSLSQAERGEKIQKLRQQILESNGSTELLQILRLLQDEQICSQVRHQLSA